MHDSVPVQYRPFGHACDELCLLADPTTPCTCRCAGRHHGAGRAVQGPDTAAVADRRSRQLVRAMSQAPSDEAF